MLGTIIRATEGTILRNGKPAGTVNLRAGQFGHVNPARTFDADRNKVELVMMLPGCRLTDRVLVDSSAVVRSLEPFYAEVEQ